MTRFGKIKSYDSDKGAGLISPDEGGNALPFRRNDLQQQAQEPSIDQRYSFNTSEVDGANKRAINLQLQRFGAPGVQEQQARAQQG